ncbi:MAG: lipopolysaccharide transport system ATP-binding protein [Chthoniobacter sp.]|jgi:lipopolysaccharide transport system ATP-binding protein|nr:lipopolysaccharide transport system ATP-binding protein [Chthoniobacter sp.]
MKAIVEVDRLSKLYALGGIGPTSLRQSLESLFGRFRGDRPAAASEAIPDDRAGPEPNTFWGIKDISFSVAPGAVVGIIGRNGAGKSTLLKILSRITEPTSGRAILRGRVVSLLEVGTGFHNELTGRENIFLNGAILGMKRTEVAARFDEIVDFAEVGKFIDTPVKRYSSGMFVRLAFAVAAHLEPEILLIDEVLAVGDAGFQKKCLGKMGQVASEQGRTVFFVSHNMGAVRSLCEEAILIEGGRVVRTGAPADVISHYLSASSPKDSEVEGQIWWNGSADAPHTDDLALRGIRLLGPQGVPQAAFEADKPIRIEINYTVLRRLRGARFVVSLMTQEGEVAFCATDHLFQQETQSPGRYQSTCVLPAGLLNRRNYLVNIQCDIPGERYLLPGAEYLGFTVSGAGNQASTFPEPWPGVVCPKIAWTVEAQT